MSYSVSSYFLFVRQSLKIGDLLTFYSFFELTLPLHILEKEMNVKAKKYLKVAGIVLASIVGLLIVAVIVLCLSAGHIAQNYLEKHGPELVGRQLTMKKLDLSPLSGTVVIDSFSMKEADGKRDFVTFDTLYVQLKIWDLLSHKVNVRHIHLDGADVKVAQRDSVFNFTDIIEKFSQPDTAADKDTTPSQKWEIGLYDIQLRHCSAHYKDLVLNTHFDMRDLNLGIPGVYFSNKLTDMGLNLNFEQGGSLKSKLKYDLETSKFDITAQVNHFTISGIEPYMRMGVRVGSVNGDMNVYAHMTGDFNHIMNFNLEGNSSIDNLKVTDDKGRLVLTTRHTSAELKKMSLADNQIWLGKVVAEDAHSQLLLDKKGGNNFTYFSSVPQAPQKKTTAAQSDAASKKPLDFRISELNFQNINLKIHDDAPRLPFNYEVSGMNIKANNVTLDKRNDVSVNGRMGGTGTFDMRWRGSVNDLTNQNIILNLTNIDLKPFTSYFDPIFAYRITGGNLSLVSQNVITNNNLKGANLLNIYDCEVEKDKTVQKPEYKVPLKMALYIVKDKDDKISIDLPVSGNVNSPEFSYKKIIVKTLLNFLVKVAESPFRSLAKLFGHDASADVDKIKIDPTLGELDVQGYDKLNKVADMIKAKPQLTLSIHQEPNYTDAISQLAVLELKRDYYIHTHAGKTAANLEPIDKDAIRQIADGDDGLKQFAATLVPDNEASGLEQKALARYRTSAMMEADQLIEKRTAAVREYMVMTKGLNAQRIKVATAPYSPSTHYSGDSFFKVDLSGE